MSSSAAASFDLTIALVHLAHAGIPSDVQELLIRGNPDRGIAPGALRHAIGAVLAEERAAIERLALEYGGHEAEELAGLIAQRSLDVNARS